MFLIVFAGAKERRGEISKFQIMISAKWGVATFSLPNVLERTGGSGIFLIYFAALSLVFELKQNLEAQPYIKKNSGWTYNGALSENN